MMPTTCHQHETPSLITVKWFARSPGNRDAPNLVAKFLREPELVVLAHGDAKGVHSISGAG
jgi:hypothetical protein